MATALAGESGQVPVESVAGSLPRSAHRLPLELVVFGLALLARLGMVLRGGGLLGNFSYDPSVYYSAGDALTFGRLPYRDFVFLHPPAIMLVLAPFGALGRLTTDHTGFIVATVAFTVLGSVNAVLVVRIVKRMGLGARSAALGGLFYALWYGSVNAEYEIRLETLGNFCLLCGLLAYAAGRTSTGRRATVLCGVGFGAAAAVKIWFAVPVVVMLAWQLWSDRRRAAAFLAGVAAALLVIGGPFFAFAPRQMASMVVSQQLGRDRSHRSPWARLRDVSGLHLLSPHLGVVLAGLLLVLLAALCVVVLVLAWRVQIARVLVLMAVAQLLMLVFSPSWFVFYADYVGPAAAVSVAAAVAAPARRPRATDPLTTPRHRLVVCSVAVVAVSTAITLIAVPGRVVSAFPHAQLAGAVANSRCVMSDSPMAMIQLDALSRGFGNGCENWVDITGRTYGVDAPPDPSIARIDNVTWQRDLYRYLESGDAVILLRAAQAGISPATMAAIQRPGVLIKVGRFVVYRTTR